MKKPDFLSLKAHAKINLYLGVGKKRSDGFHDICSLMQEISVADDMKVLLNDTDSCSLRVFGANIGDDNSVFSAYNAFRNYTKLDVGLEVSLLKNIPLGSGLGGASSDAASLILAMDALLGTKLSYSELLSIALEVGSDVPFFLKGGTARVEGRGEKVAPFESFFSDFVGILVFPGFASYTAEAYALLDASRKAEDDDVPPLEGVDLFNKVPFNSFEAPLFERYPKLREIKDVFLAFAANFALMSGSGSSVYGLFSSWKCAKEAWDYISNKWDKCSFFIPIEK